MDPMNPQYEQAPLGVFRPTQADLRMSQPQELPTPQWQEIAVSDTFRRADSRQQNQLKALYFRDVAPIAYGEAWQNPQTRTQIINRINSFRLPPKLEDEDAIIRPETLTLDGFKQVIQTEEFARKDFKEQQELKSVWFHRLAATNPEFKQMTPEQQQAYYRRLMTARPGFSSNLYNISADEGVTGLLIPMDTEDAEELVARGETVQSGLAKFQSNFMGNFLQGASNLLT